MAAALSAARLGAKVILVERYGKLGGLATGGLVMMIPYVYGPKGMICSGIQREWVERLKEIPEAIYAPEMQESGEEPSGSIWNEQTGGGVFFDPEVLSILFCDMISAEKNITTYLHTWVTKAYLEDGVVKGVIFESKEGRKAILSKAVIDCTGDGDIFASAGAAYEYSHDAPLLNSHISLIIRVAGADYAKFATYKHQNGKAYQEKAARLREEVGWHFSIWPANRNDNAWINNAMHGSSSLSVKDLTALEFKYRLSYPQIQDFFRREFPGFEHCHLLDFASQIGVRPSRRIKGEYRIKISDINKGVHFEDSIASSPALSHVSSNHAGKHEIFIPYRSLVPERLENLLAAGRCISCDVESHNRLNLIPYSTATGEAAGAAAYLALNENVPLRCINIKQLQKILMRDKGCFIGL